MLIDLNVKTLEVCYYFVNVLRFFFFSVWARVNSLFVGRSPKCWIMSLKSKMTCTSLNPESLYRIKNRVLGLRTHKNHRAQVVLIIALNCGKCRWKLFTRIPVHWDAVGDHFQSWCSFQSRTALAFCCPVPAPFNLCFLMVRLQKGAVGNYHIIKCWNWGNFHCFLSISTNSATHFKNSDKFLSLNLPLINS